MKENKGTTINVTVYGRGWLRLRCGGKRYEIRRGWKREWEVAFWDESAHDWKLSSDNTPEGVFKTRGAALDALFYFIDARSTRPVVP